MHKPCPIKIDENPCSATLRLEAKVVGELLEILKKPSKTNMKMRILSLTNSTDINFAVLFIPHC